MIFLNFQDLERYIDRVGIVYLKAVSTQTKKREDYYHLAPFPEEWSQNDNTDHLYCILAILEKDGSSKVKKEYSINPNFHGWEWSEMPKTEFLAALI